MRNLVILVCTINLFTLGCQTATRKSVCGTSCGACAVGCADTHIGVAAVKSEPRPTQKKLVETNHIEKKPIFEIPETTFKPEPQPEPQELPTPQRSHGKDYRWLVGNLQRVHSPKHQWKIRYADLDQHDEWGGSMILASDARMDEWNDGDLVYVEGEILTARPSLYLTGPLYRVRIIRAATEVTQIIPRKAH